MITIAVLKNCTDNLTQRRLLTATDHAHADAPSRQLRIPATDTLNNSLNHNPSYRCLPAASKHTAIPRSHFPHQPNPHSGMRGILRAPSPRVLSLAAFGRRPLAYVAPMSLAGIRNPQQKMT